MTKLLNAADVANLLNLNLSTSTLAKMRLSGNTPKYIKMGRRVAYRQSDLDAWIETQSFQSTSEYNDQDAA